MINSTFLKDLYEMIESDVKKVNEEKGSEYAEAFLEGAKYSINLVMWFLSLQQLQKEQGK